MPSPRRSGGSGAVLLATGAVIVGALIFAAVVNVSSSRKSTNKAGTDLFIVGQADDLARTVSRSGPLLLQDLLGRSRDIYVQHLGGDDWRTFEAHAPGAPRRCALRWIATENRFTDPCDNRSYAADGTGLTRFPTHVDQDGRIVVDLRQPQEPTTTPVSEPAPSPAPPSSVSPPPS